jgi:hypothetical protein
MASITVQVTGGEDARTLSVVQTADDGTSTDLVVDGTVVDEFFLRVDQAKAEWVAFRDGIGRGE